MTGDNAEAGLVRAECIDMDPKIDLAIDTIMRLLYSAVTNPTAASGHVLTSAEGTSTHSRNLCNIIVNSFGIVPDSPSQKGDDIDHVMRHVVWSNLGRFITQTVGQTIAIWSDVVTRKAITVFGGIPPAAGVPLMEASAVARMLIKCACDLVIIVDRAVQFDGRKPTKEQIERAADEYISRKGISYSRRKRVHREVNDLIPLTGVVVQIYTQQYTDTIRDGIRRIIDSNRVPSGQDLTVTGKEAEYDSDSMSEDQEDLEKICGNPTE